MPFENTPYFIGTPNPETINALSLMLIFGALSVGFTG